MYWRKQGEPITNQDEILDKNRRILLGTIHKHKCLLLYCPKNYNEHVPDVSRSEVRSALDRMSNDKAAIVTDKVSGEALKAGGKVIHDTLSNACTKCIRKKIPEKWKIQINPNS